MNTSSVARATAAAGVLACLAVAPSAAFAHDVYISDGAAPIGWNERHANQHGATLGHLAGSSTPNIDVVSKLRLKNVDAEKIADVGVSPDGNTAYLGAWGGVTCKYNGVHVVDIANPANPREKAFIPSKEGSAPGEGVQALKLTTPSFNGEILVTNNEKCNARSGFGGMNIYNISNPTHPTPLAEGVGDFTVNGQGKKAANEIHSVFAWDAGDKGYAVIVDNEEFLDVDILDITNPKKARVIAEYDLGAKFPQILQAMPENLIEVFLHDMIVKEIDGRQIMLLSYWDGGYIKLDVTNPLDPSYIADSDFADPDPEATESGLTVPPEGNAHQAEFTTDNQYIVGADEDFNPYKLVARNDDDDNVIPAASGNNTRQLEEGETITGPSVFVGRACPGDPIVPVGGVGTQIAVVERGACDFTVKVAAVIAAGGYEAILVFNRTDEDGCSAPINMDVEGDIPAFGVASRELGLAIFDLPYDDAECIAGDGTQLAPIAIGAIGDQLTFSMYFDGWGYARLLRNENGKLTELDTYAIPEAHDPAFSSDYGDLSVHEVATSSEDARRVYFSYYTGGFRVAQIENDEIVEKGHYIDADGNNFWGVQTFEHGNDEYVAASDRDHGLWIFKYNE